MIVELSRRLNWRVLCLVILAASLLMGTIARVVSSSPASPVEVAPHTTLAKPFPHCLAALGVVEPSSRCINIAAEVPGVIVKLLVREQDHVRRGDALAILDERATAAAVEVCEAELAQAEQRLSRLKSPVRQEDLNVLQSAVDQERAVTNDLASRLERTRRLFARQASTETELEILSFGRQAAEARLSQKERELDRAKAGAWIEDVRVAVSELNVARAHLQHSQVLHDQRTIRAPVDGEILRVTTAVGEHLAPGAGPLLVMGDTHRMNVRVSVDEHLLGLLPEAGNAVAVTRDSRSLRIPITHLRTVPLMIPKASLGSAIKAPVDVRTLEVLYEIENASQLDVYAMQVLDVFLETGLQSPAIHGEAKVSQD